jgi:putative membrane protein
MRRDRCIGASLGAAVLCLVFSGAGAQLTLSEDDRDFIEEAAKGGHAEVAMGKSAAESKNPAVSAFGKRMVEEHGRMNDELAALAKRKGVEPPASPDLGSQAKGAAMDVLPGKTFDSQYVSSQLDDHKETLELFQREAQEGQDPDLRAFAAEGVPIIQKHISQLEELQRRPEFR